MLRIVATLLIIIISMPVLWAQNDYALEDDYATQEDPLYVTDSVETGVETSANKYIILSVAILLIIAFYFLMYGLLDKELAKGDPPLVATASQCLKFALISLVIITLVFFALSGFNYQSFWTYIGANLGYVMMVFAIWIIYLIVIFTYRSKGGTR